MPRRQRKGVLYLYEERLELCRRKSACMYCMCVCSGMYTEGGGRFACPEVHTEVFIYSGAIQNMNMRVLQDELDERGHGGAREDCGNTRGL